jgi:hypothetical protein
MDMKYVISRSTYISDFECFGNSYLVMAQGLQSQVRLCGICGVGSDTRPGIHQVLRFPLPILIVLTAPYSLSILSSTLLLNKAVKSRQNSVPERRAFEVMLNYLRVMKIHIIGIVLGYNTVRRRDLPQIPANRCTEIRSEVLRM